MSDPDTVAQAFRSGYTPEVRVWLQEIGPDGRAGPMMRRLEHQTHVSVHRETAGGGSAVIALSNRDDRFFRKKFKRSPGLGSRGDDYLTDMLKRSWHRTSPINPDRAERSPFEGARTFATQADIANYIGFLYDFSGVNTIGIANGPAEIDGEGRVGPDAPGGRRPRFDSDLVDLGLMQRVVIDARGQDGRWHAWFTGVVCGIEDGYRVKDVPTIALRCRDYMRLLQLSEIALRAGSGADQLSNLSLEARLQQKSKQGSLVRFCTSLANLTGPQILHSILDLVNRTYCWLPYAMSQLDLDGYAFNADSLAKSGVAIPGSLNREDFWRDEGFWYVPFFDKVQLQASYIGQDTLRRRTEEVHVYNPGSIAKGVQEVVRTTGPSDDEEEFPVAALSSTLLVDANLGADGGGGYQGQAYRFLIENLLGLWQVDRTTADLVVRKVADASFYDIFFDGNGSMVYQIPKYNNLPGDYSVSFTKTRLVSASFASNRDQLVSNNIPTSESNFNIPETQTVQYGPHMQPGGPYDHFDFAPSAESGLNFAWQHHGFGYVLTDSGVRSWRLSSSEEPIVTDVEVPGQLGIINLDQNMQNKFFSGRTPFDQVRKDQARFGHRFLRSSPIVLPKDFRAGMLGFTPTLDAMAVALMRQLNGRAVTGTIEMSSRSDIDVGLTVLLLERQHVFYVTAIDHQVRYGKGADATTTLTLSFGHDLGQQYPNPWVSAGQSLAATQVKLEAEGGAAYIAGRLTGSVSGLSAASGVAFGADAVAESDAPIQSGVGHYEARAKGAPLRGLAELRRKFAATSTRPLTATTPVPTTTNSRVTYIPDDIDTLVSIATTKAASLGLKLKSKDEYTMARALVSEGADVLELLVVGFNLLYNFKVGAITSGLVRGGKSRFEPPAGQLGHYGNQRAGRFLATTQDPTAQHLLVAQAILNGSVASPIPSGGGYFSPTGLRAIRLREEEALRKHPEKSFKTVGTSVALVEQRYAAGLGWLPVDGLSTARFFCFAKAEVKGVNVYGVAPLAQALIEVRRWDNTPK